MVELLFQNDQFVICIKPVGLDSEHQLPQALQDAICGEIYPVHRLDQNVGGVMLYARTKAAAAYFSSIIQEGKIIKEYVALVHGTPPEQGDWEDLLFKDSRRNKVFVVDRQRNGVKKAKLTFTRIKQDPALVQIRLYTGRSHQIRVQFASRGYPLLGDRKYGARDTYSAPMLYSFRLTFPYQEKTLEFSHLPEWAKME